LRQSSSHPKNGHRQSLSRVRIIGGRWRSRIIRFQEVNGLRPTGDRIRETLFNWLSADITGARCLDAFAGSGALGFEALSRGASEVVFVEKNTQAARQLETNKTSLEAENAVIVQDDLFRWLERGQQPFDIVFADPPFSAEILPLVVSSLTQANLLKPGTLVYLESLRSQTVSLPPSWLERKSKEAGAVRYQLMECN
jgi:16S rRNA (guanine966-N2)-methyltransferase